MELKEPVFRTRRARNAVWERIVNCIELAGSVEELRQCWSDFREELKLIKLDSEQKNDGDSADENFSAYDEIKKTFLQRKLIIEENENVFREA